MMDYASSPTPFVVHPWEQVQYEIPRPLRQAPAQQTMFSKPASEFEVFDGSARTDTRTLFGPPLSRRSGDAAPKRPQAAPVHREASDTIASQRVQLLAAQYATGNHAKELQARLEILNHRLLEKSPRVSVEQVEFLEGINAQLDTLSAKRVARAERLGLQMDRSKEVQVAMRTITRG
jgi:hypothetical protein